MNGSFRTGQLSAPQVVACWAIASQPLGETILYHDEVSIIIIIRHACMKNGCSDDDDEFIFVTNCYCLSSLVRDDCLSLHSFKKLLKTALF